MYNQQNYNKRTVIAGVALFGFFMVTIIAFSIYNLAKTATLDILIAPSFAKVEINNHTYKTKDTIKLFPGEYTATISADGFLTQEINLSLTANEQNPLYVYLEPTPDNIDFYQNNYQEEARVQEIGERLTTIAKEQFLGKYGIARYLPYEYSAEDRFGDPIGYRIDYGKFDGCNSDFCLQVTGYLKSNLEEAKEYIKSKGFNPDDYQILFNYTPIEKAKPEDFPESIRKIMEEAGYFDN